MEASSQLLAVPWLLIDCCVGCTARRRAMPLPLPAVVQGRLRRNEPRRRRTAVELTRERVVKSGSAQGLEEWGHHWGAERRAGASVGGWSAPFMGGPPAPGPHSRRVRLRRLSQQRRSVIDISTGNDRSDCGPDAFQHVSVLRGFLSSHNSAGCASQILVCTC